VPFRTVVLRDIHALMRQPRFSNAGPLTIYAAHMRDRALGRAGSWLLHELQALLA